MLGLSLGKILFTILVIIAVWKGFALVNRLAREQKQALAQRASQRASQADQRASERPASRRAPQGTVDLVRCARCGAYFDPGEGCTCRG